MITTAMLDQTMLERLTKQNGELVSFDLTLTFKNGAIIKVQQQEVVEANTELVGLRIGQLG